MRPPKDARVAIRLNEEEKLEMEKAAAAEDMTVSQFVRRLFLDWKKKKRI